jgi:hypothetical protein
LIERLQRRVELGEGAFLAGRQALGVVAAADEAAHARIESPGGLVGFRLAFQANSDNTVATGGTSF